MFRFNPNIFKSFVGGIRILFMYILVGVIFVFYENRILLDFTVPNLNPVDFSHLLISLMAFCMIVFDVFIFFPFAVNSSIVGTLNGFEW